MWDNIVIGKGEHFCSAHLVFSLGDSNKHSICENSNSYWITHSFAGIEVGIKVFKNTSEGKEITDIIQNKKGLSKLNQYLDKLTLARIKPSVFKSLIENQRKEDYELGRTAKEDKIKNVLGIRHS